MRKFLIIWGALSIATCAHAGASPSLCSYITHTPAAMCRYFQRCCARIQADYECNPLACGGCMLGSGGMGAAIGGSIVNNPAIWLPGIVFGLIGLSVLACGGKKCNHLGERQNSRSPEPSTVQIHSLAVNPSIPPPSQQGSRDSQIASPHARTDDFMVEISLTDSLIEQPESASFVKNDDV